MSNLDNLKNKVANMKAATITTSIPNTVDIEVSNVCNNTSMLNACYVTLATDTNYLLLAGRLQQRLKYLNSKYNHIVLTTQECVDENIELINQLEIQYKLITLLDLTNIANNRLYALSLTDYNFICNIDADVILINSIDAWFEAGCGNMLDLTTPQILFSDVNSDENDNLVLDTSLFIARPNEDRFQILTNYLKQHNNIKDLFCYYYTDPKYIYNLNNFAKYIFHLGFLKP